MNKHGVTRYNANKIVVKSKKEGAYWGDPGNSDSTRFAGAIDLVENVSWGWHHPNGVYNTIPVGAPLIDGEMNIYLGSDDAIRKFTPTGELIWSYGPRGQLAAAPTLLLPSSRREVNSSQGAGAFDSVSEEAVRPDWDNARDQDEVAQRSFATIRVTDRLQVRPGVGYHADGKEFYRAGDVGMVTKIISGADGTQKARIEWTRTGHQSVANLATMGKRFVRLQRKATTLPAMLLGSTTSGYVFALDLSTGEELWAAEASTQIAGVKGAVSGKNGMVVAATNRCVDRYCYKYRNETNPLTRGNSVVRGFIANDGSAAWSFKPTSPVWNFVPQYGSNGDTVMFNDFEGTVYCLDLFSGSLRWKVEGSMGTTTQAHALYFEPANLIYQLGVKHYEHKYCNPFPAPGILIHCDTYPYWPGFLKALNASSGRVQWEYEFPQPPSSIGVGMMFEAKHTRLIVTLGKNCFYNSPTMIYAIDPSNGHFRWSREGPTLWDTMCAGDREGGDIRRAMTGRAICEPGAWSAPAMDMYGDLYIGNQVGELQRWGTRDRTPGMRKVELLSTLETGVAFQDLSISFAPGMMAVTTCTSLIVFQTYGSEPTISSDVWDMGPSPLVY